MSATASKGLFADEGVAAERGAGALVPTVPAAHEWDHGLMATDDTESAPKVIRCEHWSEELGRFGGWHHHEGPHACDWRNHDGECPYWFSVGGRPNLESQ